MIRSSAGVSGRSDSSEDRTVTAGRATMRPSARSERKTDGVPDDQQERPQNQKHDGVGSISATIVPMPASFTYFCAKPTITAR